MTKKGFLPPPSSSSSRSCVRGQKRKKEEEDRWRRGRTQVPRRRSRKFDDSVRNFCFGIVVLIGRREGGALASSCTSRGKQKEEPKSHSKGLDGIVARTNKLAARFRIKFKRLSRKWCGKPRHVRIIFFGESFLSWTTKWKGERYGRSRPNW